MAKTVQEKTEAAKPVQETPMSVAMPESKPAPAPKQREIVPPAKETPKKEESKKEDLLPGEKAETQNIADNIDHAEASK